jgi:nicotinamidase-related amidase
MNIDKDDTAVVFIDPQNEVLSEKGLAWPLVHESLRENNTIENMERIFKAAKAPGFEVFISPHYFYPADKGWKFNGPLETDEATSGMFARKGVLNLDGLEGSGADWLARFKPYIQDGKTAKRSWSHRTACGGQRPTTSFYNCANAGSAKSFLAECWRTCASNPICAN